MARFKEFIQDGSKDKRLEDLDEGALRTLGAGALFARIANLSRKIKREKDAKRRSELLASQITHLAMLMMAVGK